MRDLRALYRRSLSEESRYFLLKLRDPFGFHRLKTRVNRHEKGMFSLCGFTQTHSIFVHITKSAGTSVAESLYGVLPSHYAAWQYRVIFGRRTFNKYFKFTFVRNPWDRLYSAYSFLKNGGWDENDRLWAEKQLTGIENFDQFVLEWLTPERLYSHIHFQPQHPFLFDEKGNLLVDFIGYYESLVSDFRYVADRVNPHAHLQHKNSSPRKHYRDAYSAAAIERVAMLYEKDVELFGYQFDGLVRKRVANGRLTDDDK